MFLQDFIKLSAAVHELLCTQTSALSRNGKELEYLVL